MECVCALKYNVNNVYNLPPLKSIDSEKHVLSNQVTREAKRVVIETVNPKCALRFSFAKCAALASCSSIAKHKELMRISERREIEVDFTNEI